MKQFLRLLLVVAAAGSGLVSLLGATVAVPPELRQDLTLYNLQSTRGVPISTTTNTYVTNLVNQRTTFSGRFSDGRRPTTNESFGSANLPTSNQFQGFLSFGASVGLNSNVWSNLKKDTGLKNGTSAFSASLAKSMGLPVALANASDATSAVMIQRRVQIGAPYLSRQVSFAFGSEIAPPASDENGVLLTGISPASYWKPQPFFDNSITDVAQGYYWSPNAKKTYAIQSGPITVTWIKAAPDTTNQLATYTNTAGLSVTYTKANHLTNIPSAVVNGGTTNLLYTARYLVSSATVKPSQKMYWTEASFAQKGQLVNVPGGRIGALHIAFNSRFPELVPPGYYVDPNDTDPNQQSITNTLWYSKSGQIGTIHAYNIEGRVFVELLGESQDDGSLFPFGFEIIDVYKQPVPTDVTVDLGERIPAYQNGTPDQETNLTPSPTLATPKKYYYQQTSAGGDQVTMYATFATQNVNDFQAYWLITGVAGLRWPFLFNRYHEVWPSDPARYAHYLRPAAETEAIAQETAVTLPGTEAPQIAYQDPLPSPYGAKLAANARFYTFLDDAHPAHRSLLQFTVGDQVAFERVYSWLDSGIRANGEALASGRNDPKSVFKGTVATNLTVWDSDKHILNFSDVLGSPRYVTNTATVGARITAPTDELGATGTYWAGYLQQASGTAFNPRAYVDPFSAGFDTANLGAIIPVNARPGSNVLEVWWFRKDDADVQRGFRPVYWPSVIGRYTIQWPSPDPASEIVLAGNQGSGPLDSLQATGSIYRQNNPAQPGYNPNEEHALMLGGQAYALRDDLNVTSGDGYTSEPFVLLDYTGSDGRPSMRLFHVQRERPEAGIVFDYVVEAGKMLQAPMPLPLLEPPIEVDSEGVSRNFNNEPSNSGGDLPTGWNSLSAESRAPFAHYPFFTYKDRKESFWVYRGLHAGPTPLAAGVYDTNSATYSTVMPEAHGQIGQRFAYYVDVSQPPASLWVTATNLPAGLSVSTTDGLAIAGTPAEPGTNVVTLVIQNPTEGNSVTLSISITVGSGPSTLPFPFPRTFTFLKGFLPNFPTPTPRAVTFNDRTPFLAEPPTVKNSFTMRFYYKTQASFDWPHDQVAVGSIVPYLLPVNSDGTGFIGAPSDGNAASLDVVYRPVWPSLVQGRPLPFLYSGETLTVPKRGMAAIRGQSSALVLYQQSIGTNITNAPQSVILHDPTVQKTSSLESMGGLPASIVSRSYLGKTYFPNLPPNLKDRFYYDPNTTNLVLQGQFVDEVVGDKYLLLNVLAGTDLANVLDLCPTQPTEPRRQWEKAVTSLSTQVSTRSLEKGLYRTDPDLTVTRFASDLVEVTHVDTAVDSYALTSTGPGTGYVTYIVGNGHDPAHAGEPVSMYVMRTLPQLYSGQVKILFDANPLSELISFQHTADLAGRSSDYEYDWRMQPPVDGLPDPADKANWNPLTPIRSDLTHYTLQGNSGIQALGDNWVTVRYRSTNSLANPATRNWSEWTEPQLAEGWIKRVLAGINPFNQRTKDLFNNPVNTTASIIAQAGHRWEGDVALNLDAINGYGLIEIYETVLNRGKSLSIDAAVPINYGPANDALLLAAGYLNDLYSMIGNDAWADAANPTIGIGSSDRTYGNIATALFAFKGQVPTLLEEELALLRGRDDFLAPGVKLNPAYNRLYWNYTRGIDAGEVIYAINYNILDQNYDGTVNAADAAQLYPQGHGDAYGHYLTALSGYYSLLMNPNFTWVPRIEAVTVLGAPVSVDYQDERKFAAAAAAVARTGRQVFDLTWRQNYHSGTSDGWDSFGTTRTNVQHTYSAPGNATRATTRYWGADHWATRVGQGAYLHWVVGNAILPPIDPNPAHEGIQKVDRTTVPELQELPSTVSQLQTDLGNAEGGGTPVGLSPRSIPFDIDPLLVTGPNPQTHFEQIYQRAVSTLNNAVVAFDDAQQVTQMMRAEEESLANYQVAHTNQETAYINRLIELYGTPYPDDIGPGKTYLQGYAGPDLLHYTYVENPDTGFTAIVPDPTTSFTYYVDVQNIGGSWTHKMGDTLEDLGIIPSTDPSWSTNETLSIAFNVGPNGFFDKPAEWTSQRGSPGKIQQAISELIAAQNKLRKAVAYAAADKQALDKAMMAFTSQMEFEKYNAGLQISSLSLQDSINAISAAYAVYSKYQQDIISIGNIIQSAVSAEIPTHNIFGTSSGGDQAKAALSGIYTAQIANQIAAYTSDEVAFTAQSAATVALQTAITGLQGAAVTSQADQEAKNAILALGNQELNLQGDLFTINEALRDLDDAQRAYRTLQAEGNRILQERLTFRQHASAIVQGYRTRDAAFRIFQNEKLARYKTLFDLAAEYAFLAAQAYDYETGLLHTQQGQSFLNRILSSRALGVVRNGQPQYAGSNTGDPGLSSALAEMKADWDVLKGRLGFNNPIGYGTTASLRSEKYRILSGTDGDANWQDVLQQGRRADLRADSDVKRYCMQLDNGSGLPVPGIVLSFSTLIADGFNLFGQPLAPGDHSYSPSSFATKIFSVGVDLEGYVGMDDPSPGGTAGGTTPPDPTLDPHALAANPYVYLIPVGADSMRSPPLGDVSTVRTWTVDDLTVPLPFNISAADFSSAPFYQSSDSLSEPLFSVRKHAAFRPVSTAAAFNSAIYSGTGALQASEYTNRRLIGRSVWNSQWKLVIPGKTLLSNPNEGLDRFIQSVKDIKLRFITYSYAGN